MALYCSRTRVFCLCLNNNVQKFSSSPLRYQARGQFRLVEVGKFESPLLYGQYESGQLFYHRVFGYRGVILFSWQAKLFDKNAVVPNLTPNDPLDREVAPSVVNAEGSRKGGDASREATPPLSTALSSPPPSSLLKSPPSNQQPPSSSSPSSSSLNSSKSHFFDGMTPLPQRPQICDIRPRSYYVVLIDGRDQENVRVRTRTTPVTLEEIENDLITVEGVDCVGHDDIQPYLGTGKYNRQPIVHPLFSDFFLHKQEAGEPPLCVPTDMLYQCQDSIVPTLAVSNVYRETTEHIRVTVTPFYIGSRSTTISERSKNSIYQLQSLRKVKEYWWQYCIRLENLGEEPVQLRERKWCIYTKKMNTINGRGVVGEEPILSPEQPAFQYVSMISLDSPSGHMWGKYKMERLNSGAFFDCEIPNFALDSKSKDQN